MSPNGNMMSSPAFFLTALVFFAATNLLSHAQIIANTRPLSIVGQLCCTNTSMCPAQPTNATVGRPLNGTIVNATCTDALGIIMAVGQNITDANGTFTIRVNVPLLEVLPNCTFRSNVNGTVCPVLGNNTSTVVGFVQVTGNFLNQLLGIIRRIDVIRVSP